MKISQRLLTYGCALSVVCLLVTSGLAGQSASPVANRVTQAPRGETRVTLTGNVHPLARAENSRGAAEGSLAMPRILLLLKRSDQQQAALQSLMEAQQDKSSSNYHAWLTPDQFGKRFGPSDPDLQALTDWLTAQGFQNVRVPAGRTVIEFSGSAGQVQNAFGTQIQNCAVNRTAYDSSGTGTGGGGVVSLDTFPKKSLARFLGDARMRATSDKSVTTSRLLIRKPATTIGTVGCSSDESEQPNVGNCVRMKEAADSGGKSFNAIHSKAGGPNDEGFPL